MGIFNELMQKVFHGAAAAEIPPDAAKPGVTPESRVAAAARQGVPVAIAVPNAPNAPGRAASGAPGGGAGQVDVAAVLNTLAASNREKLDWSHSIVDLMKLVGMDSSLSSRKALAADLHYTGDTNDSATMNVWLHKEVMTKLAANGGKVPQELLAR